MAAASLSAKTVGGVSVGQGACVGVSVGNGGRARGVASGWDVGALALPSSEGAFDELARGASGTHSIGVLSHSFGLTRWASAEAAALPSSGCVLDALARDADIAKVRLHAAEPGAPGRRVCDGRTPGRLAEAAAHPSSVDELAQGAFGSPAASVSAGRARCWNTQAHAARAFCSSCASGRSTGNVLRALASDVAFAAGGGGDGTHSQDGAVGWDERGGGDPGGGGGGGGREEEAFGRAERGGGPGGSGGKRDGAGSARPGGIWIAGILGCPVGLMP